MKRHCLQLVIAIIICISTCSPEAGEAEEEFGPWSSTKDSPMISSVEASSSEGGSGSYASSVFFVWLWVYQHQMSVVMRSKCAMTPSCSAYGIEAIKKHGAPKGLLLTFDRLIHEADERHSGYRVMKGPLLKVLDPVENNDFWWKK
ncbi:MAG: membrane protein insertion efficiency factor YidD [Kiritimatiellia bacterium]|nr:membrane protein insertion efficiency factor YidD [Kiritimatiellia bacterium]